MSSLFPQPGAPFLPQFKTLLVKGAYHPSAPVHLALSHLTDSLDREALIITPVRQLALQQYSDDWLTVNSGYGSVASISARVKLLSVVSDSASWPNF